MLYVLLAIAVFGLTTSSVFTGMTLVAVPRFLRERRAAEATLRERPGFTPALTLLKPLAGAEPDLERHLASFFEQDYPEFEILFCDPSRRKLLPSPRLVVVLSTGLSARSARQVLVDGAEHRSIRHNRLPLRR